MTWLKIILTFLLLANISAEKNNGIRAFPEKFRFGAATSSYQIEGGWNAAEKRESIWDRLTHATNFVANRSSGDVACDSYNQHERDIEMLVELGVDYYRFSLSWSRLLPDGLANGVSEDGLRYYHELIDDLLAADVVPIVTLYHWDLPQSLQDLGGWTNPMIVKYFAEYASLAFKYFGDRVKTWLTINEPSSICLFGYGDLYAPSLNMSGIADYICTHNLLKAHAEVYHLYDDIYKPMQKGRIGIVLSAGWWEAETNSAKDIQAADASMQFDLGWHAHPIFSIEGDYPQVMKENVATKSLQQGYTISRLPEFTKDEIEFIRGTADFFGLNHYSSFIVKKSNDEAETKAPNFYDDIGSVIYQEESWQSSATKWFKVAPWGFTKLLNWITKNYNSPEILVFENGFSDRGTLDDYDRVSFLNKYLNALLDAVEDGVNVTAYTVWSLMDNFEWLSGYTEKFGLYHVNFDDSKRTRTPKKSAFYYKKITESRTIERNINFG